MVPAYLTRFVGRDRESRWCCRCCVPGRLSRSVGPEAQVRLDWPSRWRSTAGPHGVDIGRRRGVLDAARSRRRRDRSAYVDARGIGLTGPLGYRPSPPVVKALRDRRLCRPSRPRGGSPAGRPSSTLGSAARPRCCGRSLVGRLRAWPHVTDLLRRAGEAAPWAGRSVFSGLRSLGFPAARWVMCGEPRTWCVSTAVTATSSPGRSAAPTRWRCCC